MTFVVVAQLYDAEGPSSGIARFTLPSYAPLRSFDSYETTWIVALNRFHVSPRMVNTVTSNTSDLPGAFRAGTIHMPKVSCGPATCDLVTPRPRSKSLTTSLEGSCHQDDTALQLVSELHEDYDGVQNTEEDQELHENYAVHSAEDYDSNTDDESDRGTNGDRYLARDGALSRIGCKFMIINYMTPVC